jgi:hypothetical protein
VKVNIKGEGIDIMAKGTYKFTDDKTLELKMDDPQKKEDKPRKSTIKSVSAEELVLIGEDGKEGKFKKEK